MSRGVVRVYLGAAPGVGTTFAMLAEGRRRADRGADVVVGAVDTHGRGQTTAMLERFELVGDAAHGLDADAVLARHPRVVLIDDLAGTGGPDQVRGTRWRDVDRIAAAGIDVVATLWVGHIESVRDLVERITGAQLHGRTRHRRAVGDPRAGRGGRYGRSRQRRRDPKSGTTRETR